MRLIHYQITLIISYGALQLHFIISYFQDIIYQGSIMPRMHKETSMIYISIYEHKMSLIHKKWFMLIFQVMLRNNIIHEGLEIRKIHVQITSILLATSSAKPL
jgi:hypothetical protein